jgi:hypothetical protein
LSWPVRSVWALLRLQVGQAVKLRQREAKELLFELSWIVSVKDGRYRRILPEWVDDYIRRVAEDQAA